MKYSNARIAEVAEKLRGELKGLKNKADILKATELKALYSEIPLLKPDERASFGKEINELKAELEALVAEHGDKETVLKSIDVTAPFDINVSTERRPRLLISEFGSKHPLMTELDNILDIFYRMGFNAVESRQIDDDFHMFGSLNFPEGHPARDDYDTFMTEEGLIAPAHTSTMQNRVLKQYKQNLDNGDDIRVVIPGRVFRNEDLDATHEHTFYQLEGVYVGKGIHAGHLIATLKTFLEEYYQQDRPAQYTERQRFEWHPENAGTPYEVLLGRVGAELLVAQGRNWEAFPAGDPASPHYFPETGHGVPEQFYAYWASHGLNFGDSGISYRESLALFGYPLSEPMMETNADGDTVLTQYFERSVFEYHPNNPVEWQVLLRRVGAEMLAERGW